MSQTLTDQQRDVLTLWYQVNASLSAYTKLTNAFGQATDALSASLDEWQQLGVHATHLSRYQKRSEANQAVASIEQALNKGHYQLLFLGERDYPAMLAQIYDPPPLLFCRGNIARLQQAQIAIVGSRKPTAYAQKITFDLAQYLAQAGYVITSGLAMGVDKQAHLGALTPVEGSQVALEGGRTIGVMGTGIDVYYPRHHDQLFEQIISQGGCIISELLPGTQANKHTFPRRNRLVAGLTLATIVTEAAVKSGSLITARLASEQGKQVFAIPSNIDNVNAEGCHYLIREGATLIYHPDQVIEDVQKQGLFGVERLTLTDSVASSFGHQPQANLDAKDLPPLTSSNNLSLPSASAQSSPKPSSFTKTSASLSIIDIPNHLQPLYDGLDSSGQDLDALLSRLNANTADDNPIAAATVLGQLMELELLGLIVQQGGRYLRA